MNSPLIQALKAVGEGRHLSAEETAGAFRVIMRGEATPAQIGALLLGLRARGETAEEVAGAASALREAMIPVLPAEGAPLVDTCGTGGGGVSTFNISTAAALVAAAAGARVPKHGNRSYTSRSGSADVLEALGVEIGAGAEAAAIRLEEAGMVFLFAPNFHPAMRHVGPTRKELGVATIMNLLGPLANPANVRRQVIGVADPSRGPLMAEALLRLGVEHALVVHGEVGMDEISPSGVTQVWEIRDGRVERWQIVPEEVGLGWDRLEDLAGGEPSDNARRIEALVSGGGDEGARRTVVLNAGAAIYVAGLVPTLGDALALASDVLESRAALEVLTRLRRQVSR
jgi:anthranilate phosphoribosyltransferase